MINLRERLDELGVENVAVFKESDTKFDTNCRILVSSYQKVGTGFSFDKLRHVNSWHRHGRIFFTVSRACISSCRCSPNCN